MKSRKWTALVAAAGLVLTMVSSTLAANVGGAMYGDSQAPGYNMPKNQVAEGLIQSGIQDVDATDPYAGSVVAAVQAGLMKPAEDGNFHPGLPAKADDTVAAFAVVLGIATAADSVEDAVQKAIAAGYVTEFEVSHSSITRMTVAKLIFAALGLTPDYSLEFPFREDHLISDPQSRAILATLHQLGIFIGDGNGSADGTIDICRNHQVQIVTGSPGRGSQMNRGAALAMHR
jgi:hypothetical protein